LADNEEKLLDVILPIFNTIPSINRHVLAYLFKFLVLVAQQAETNRMTAYNLSIVFGPSLLRPKEDTIETSLKSPKANFVVQTFINHYARVFPT